MDFSTNIVSERHKKLKKFHPRQIYKALTYKPYLVLLSVYMLCWLAVQIIQGNFALFARHALKMENDYFYLLMVLVISMIASMFLWQIFMLIFNKKLTLILGSWIVLFSLLVILIFLDENTLYLNYFVSFVAGIGVSTFYLVPWSMLPDVVDSAYLFMGVRMEEMYFGFFVFFSKFGSGLALGISNLGTNLI